MTKKNKAYITESAFDTYYLNTLLREGCMMQDNPILFNGIFIGDRIIELAHKLAYYTKVHIGGEIPMIERDYPFTRQLECVACALGAKRKLLYSSYKKLQGEGIILEDNGLDQFNPASIQSELEEEGIKTSIIPFFDGEYAAIESAGKVFQLEGRAEKFLKKYIKDREKIVQNSELFPLSVVVLLGIMNPETYEGYLFLEVPNSASDKHLLQALGANNVTKEMMTDEEIHLDGLQRIYNLDNLERAKPDVIILTGEARIGQNAIRAQIAKNPKLIEQVPALAKQQIVSLPHYCLAKIYRYPEIFNQWKMELSYCFNTV